MGMPLIDLPANNVHPVKTLRFSLPNRAFPHPIIGIEHDFRLHRLFSTTWFGSAHFVFGTTE
jgi:hypothetical protein